MSSNSTDESSVTPEALQSRVDELQIPQERTSLQSLFDTLGSQALRELRKSNKWAQIEGFRDTAVNEVVRKRLSAAAAQNEGRSKSLIFWWLSDHQELIEELEQSISASSIRRDVLDVLEQGFDAIEVAWALRFDEREEIKSALDDGLWDELHDDKSPLLSQRTVRRLKQKNGELQAELKEEKDENVRLEDEISDLESELEDVEHILKEEQECVSHLEEQVAEIRSEKERVEEDRNELSDQIDDLEKKLEKKESSMEETQECREQLKEKVEEVLGSVASTLGLSTLPDDISTAGDEIEERVMGMQSQIASLEEKVDTLEGERDTLAPALDHISDVWEVELEKLADDVDSELPTHPDDHEGHDPIKDWEKWIEEERTLVVDLLNCLDNPEEQHLSIVSQVQASLCLRWYLLEWIRYGLLRHLWSTSAVADHISESN